MRDEIIEMAEEAGFEGFDPWACWPENLERFYDLAIQRERERIKAANAPEIERCNAYIKTLEEALRKARGERQ